ncbi:MULTISPECIES: ribosome assembly RNA-binding protein YhbY [Spongiibacter]|jgi:RNA-binding protein|uniref:ribosome assembly RNA-binding protein YhbY n=1 Tax=Spongiibacter TaxID=630749 RepID=UPI0003B70A52|nr:MULTISPECIES: ribosome assembly RNA-binding protein YhbY [Spongiibacter]MAY38932.1 ribosome assembly RNA-binding protein YhbY [Spongiibacter sp.]MBI56952.1 ribosome assembly RNA-binding protein YhbY [Spongiibacter sp.]MBO6753896.1 ribosome assembly RNA-binding protein YhbY [Spongiibacter sp.]MBU71275.1 ribosome assembly RNA-binding protein YhbY [Spongiibacter sp.]|tara:strand:- start:22954 stop:23262 length:309 start_codon:yes stop_codon:yes gene_type:complete
MKTLTASDKKQLRSIGHNLNPVVMIGDKGLSEGVMLELNRALEDHELIKVKVNVADPQERREVIEQLCTDSRAELVQAIGKIALLYRAAQKPNPRLSNLLRG